MRSNLVAEANPRSRHLPEHTRLAAVGLLSLTTCAAGPAFADWPSDPLVNLPICTLANQQTGGKLVTDGAGGAIVSWFDDRNGGNTYHVYAQHVLASGAVDPEWPVNGRELCDTTGTEQSPTIVTDGAGGAILAWQDARATGTAGFDIYAQHVRANGTLDPAWPHEGSALCTAQIHQILPVAVADGAGGAIVAWQDQRFVTTADDVFAQHVLANGTVDPAWPVDGLALSTAVGTQQRLNIVASGVGNAIVTWSDTKGGVGIDDIFAQRVLANGTRDPAWPVNGRAVCSAAGAQTIPVTTPDGSGGAIVAWMDGRAGTSNLDIYAQRVLVNGTIDPAWPVNGRALCSADSNQRFPAIARSDGPGMIAGAIVAWIDDRPGMSAAVFAQHVFRDGTVDPAWPVGGRGVCTVASTKFNLAMAPDGAGGAIGTWEDHRNSIAALSNYDVYAQHVQAGGSFDPEWPVDGTAVSTAFGDQDFPSIIPDGGVRGAGLTGAILAWTDVRTGSQFGDIYAQRVQANGLLGGTVLDVPRETAIVLSIEAVHPNPWRGGTLRLSCSLATDAAAHVEVIDIAGRRIAAQELPSSTPGRTSATLKLGSHVAPGVYLVRLRQSGRMQCRRFVVLE